MQSIQESASQNSIHFKPIKVLVADDDPPTRLLLKAGILRWGYKVVEAVNGEEAWEILNKTDPPDILILDWMMPVLDGIGLCERIKGQLSYKPYIILLTQIAGSQNIIKGLEAGADEYLSKPFNMAELQSRLSVGARLVNYKIQLKEHTAKANEITSQISILLEELSQSDNPEKIQRISELNSELKNKIKLLVDLHKGPLI
ncbi:MAG: response regulator [Gammaproteobacteria bacterium]